MIITMKIQIKIIIILTMFCKKNLKLNDYPKINKILRNNKQVLIVNLSIKYDSK